MKNALVLVLASAAAATACGKTVSLDDRTCPCADGWTCCSDRNECVPQGGSCSSGGSGSGEASSSGSGTATPGAPGVIPPLGPVSFSPAAVANAKQRCNAAVRGTADDPTSPHDTVPKISHAWLTCEPDQWLDSKHADGILFRPDSTWVLLRLDGAGNLASLDDPTTEGKWYFVNADDDYYDPNDPYSEVIAGLALRDSGGSNGVTYPTLSFEHDPRRMQLVPTAWYVDVEP
jgi:hypothetical protein